nr:hypothetical protein GCM10020092_080980 [Actinoplanes digitatis]
MHAGSGQPVGVQQPRARLGCHHGHARPRGGGEPDQGQRGDGVDQCSLVVHHDGARLAQCGTRDPPGGRESARVGPREIGDVVSAHDESYDGHPGTERLDCRGERQPVGDGFHMERDGTGGRVVEKVGENVRGRDVDRVAEAHRERYADPGFGEHEGQCVVHPTAGRDDGYRA